MSRIFLLCLALFAYSRPLYSNTIQAFYSSVNANDFSVYEENGKVGLKNLRGEVLIPAKYDAIGWSNGRLSVVNNVTGYRSNGLWGLISTGNEVITKAEYEDLSPGEGSLIVARKKVPGSVRVQAGCINTAGKEIIPFLYDGLRVSSFRAIVYIRNGARFKHGLIDFGNKLLIPLQYQNIYPLGSLRYGVENFENKNAIFSEDGKQITSFLIDSISAFKKDLAVIYQNQRQGLIDRQGQIKLEPTYRELRINDDGSVSARQADAWLWLDGSNKLIRQFNADSVTVLDSNRMKIAVGGKVQLTDKDFKPLSNLLCDAIGTFKNGKALFISHDGKRGIINRQGAVVLRPDYEQLIIDPPYLRAIRTGNKRGWVIMDSTGNALTSKLYDYAGPYNGSYFPVQHRGYWGAVNSKGKEIVACVHDSLIQQHGDHIVVKFKGQYGIINLKEDWVVTPQAARLALVNGERYLQRTPKTSFLKTFDGQLIYFSDNRIEVKNNYLLEQLPSGTVWKIDMHGVITDRAVQPEGVEKVFTESEGLRAIRKDGRYGFIDNRGRLRIANRYEDVRDFSQGLAAVKIRGRWGFINHQDNIAIQPVYDEVSLFTNDVAKVRQRNLFGLVDKTGRQVVPARYDSLVVLPGKRFMVLQNNLWGLVDNSGNIIIQAKYDQLTDLNNGYVIVSRNSKFGLLTLEGISTIPQIYDGLIFDPYHQEYIALKKAVWDVMKF